MREFTPNALITLAGFHADIVELSKIPVERGYRHVFGRRSRGDQAVHEMDLRFSITIQRVQVNRGGAGFHTRAGGWRRLYAVRRLWVAYPLRSLQRVGSLS